MTPIRALGVPHDPMSGWKPERVSDHLLTPVAPKQSNRRSASTQLRDKKPLLIEYSSYGRQVNDKLYGEKGTPPLPWGNGGSTGTQREPAKVDRPDIPEENVEESKDGLTNSNQNTAKFNVHEISVDIEKKERAASLSKGDETDTPVFSPEKDNNKETRVNSPIDSGQEVNEEIEVKANSVKDEKESEQQSVYEDDFDTSHDKLEHKASREAILDAKASHSGSSIHFDGQRADTPTTSQIEKPTDHQNSNRPINEDIDKSAESRNGRDKDIKSEDELTKKEDEQPLGVTSGEIIKRNTDHDSSGENALKDSRTSQKYNYEEVKKMLAQESDTEDPTVNKSVTQFKLKSEHSLSKLQKSEEDTSVLTFDKPSLVEDTKNNKLKLVTKLTLQSQGSGSGGKSSRRYSDNRDGLHDELVEPEKTEPKEPLSTNLQDLSTEKPNVDIQKQNQASNKNLEKIAEGPELTASKPKPDQTKTDAAQDKLDGFDFEDLEFI